MVSFPKSSTNDTIGASFFFFPSATSSAKLSGR
jgi:hypothetical protein